MRLTERGNRLTVSPPAARGVAVSEAEPLGGAQRGGAGSAAGAGKRASAGIEALAAWSIFLIGETESETRIDERIHEVTERVSRVSFSAQELSTNFPCVFAVLEGAVRPARLRRSGTDATLGVGSGVELARDTLACDVLLDTDERKPYGR